MLINNYLFISLALNQNLFLLLKVYMKDSTIYSLKTNKYYKNYRKFFKI
jgi:hypothetical protein